MVRVAGVRFKSAGKVYFFDPGEFEVEINDPVIVETARGLEFGTVTMGITDIKEGDVVQPLKKIVRMATDEDVRRHDENEKKKAKAMAQCQEKVDKHGLEMKLIDVEYTFDNNKIIFYFTADGRVDFRELVKDLASVFKMRIELRQIGVRDEAKMMGGIGCCGRSLCCATFLDEFVPVSIRMAKEQSLSLNPTKISGICGRLMCCLKYENDCYVSRRKERRKIQAPKQGCRVATMEGDGKVISVSEQRRTATILLDDSKTIVASWEDIVEKEDEAVSAEEMAAAIAVATMLNEREQAALAEAAAADNHHGRRERNDGDRKPRRREFRDNKEGRGGHGPKGPRPEKGKGDGREKRENKGEHRRRDNHNGEPRPPRGPRPERANKPRSGENGENK